MYAIVRVAGRQYRAVPGEILDVNRLPQETGETITIDEVLLVSNDNEVMVGQPTVAGAIVEATVTEQFRGEKLIVFKYRQRTTYRRKQGHRQYHTRLHIDRILLNGEAVAEAEEVPIAPDATVEEAAEEPLVTQAQETIVAETDAAEIAGDAGDTTTENQADQDKE